MKDKRGLKPIIDTLPKNVRKAILSKGRRNINFIIADDPNKEADIEQMKKMHIFLEKEIYSNKTIVSFFHTRILVDIEDFHSKKKQYDL